MTNSTDIKADIDRLVIAILKAPANEDLIDLLDLAGRMMRDASQYISIDITGGHEYSLMTRPAAEQVRAELKAWPGIDIPLWTPND